ncbi:hypothetical protein E4U09_006769 [Claviceps aff. purpurea]|uniref:Uncharacterized protein n=1 Tax=Claviceps aff. purpurea TaxID=1967640 RepID=A0A9P7QAP8_9HYPO|nr:hypothetical protein E4U09_006769 [Claviceps aff. purpurea]
MAYIMPDRPRPTRESVTVSMDCVYDGILQHVDDAYHDFLQHVDDAYHDFLQHVDDAYHDLYHYMEGDWYELLELAHGDTLPVFNDYAVIPSLIAFSMAWERQEADEGDTAQLPLIIRDEIRYGESVAWLYESEDREPELREVKTQIMASVGEFWYEIREQPQRHDLMTMTPFDMVWRLLERQKQMAEAGEGHTARIDRLLDLLLQEEFVGLFPMVLTKEQWARIFLADFELEDCKMLYILEMHYCFIELPVILTA